MDGTIAIRDGTPHRQAETKTSRARTVALPAATVHAIRQRLAAIDQLEEAGKREPPTPDTLLFSTRTWTLF